MLKYVAATVLLLAASPVFAQGATQSPPAPNSSAGGPVPSNSVPSGALTMNPAPLPGSTLGGASTTGAPPMVQTPGAGAPSAAMSNTVPTPSK